VPLRNCSLSHCLAVDAGCFAPVKILANRRWRLACFCAVCWVYEPVITVCGPHVLVPVMTLCGLFRLQAVGTALTDSAQQSISGQKQSAKVEPGFVDVDHNHYYIHHILWHHCVVVSDSR